jgi:hypothetical protein
MHCQLDQEEEDSLEDSSSSASGTRGRKGKQRPAIQHAGKFGSLDVVPADEMLPKPHLPGLGHLHRSSSRSGSSRGPQGMRRPLPLVPPLPGQQHSSSSSSSSSGYSYTPLSGSSIVQQHQVAASDVRLVLGHARLAAAASSDSSSSTKGTSSSSGSSGSGSLAASLAVSPPNRFGVAGLKAVDQLGLSGKPVIVVGWDVWARQRAVLCLKAGKLFLSAAPS